MLFKEAGSHTIKIAFNELSESTFKRHGDLGPLRFSYNAPYTTDITDLPSDAGFSIYPNPSSGEFSITLEQKGDAEISITNTMGQLVYSGLFADKTEVRKNIASGTYIVSIRTANSIKTQKLVVSTK